MVGIPQRRKTEAGAKLASGFSRVWEVRSKSRKLSPRKTQLKKSLLPSAASTTPGGLRRRWTAYIFSQHRVPGGSARAPTRRSAPRALPQSWCPQPVPASALQPQPQPWLIPVPARPLPAIPGGRRHPPPGHPSIG